MESACCVARVFLLLQKAACHHPEAAAAVAWPHIVAPRRPPSSQTNPAPVPLPKPDTTLRVAIYGADPAADWLDALSRDLRPGAMLALFGAASAAAGPDTIARHATNASDAVSTLTAAAAAYPGDDLVILRARTALPRLWCERLTRALTEADVLVASPLDNADPARAPLPEGAHSAADAATIDVLCYRLSRHQLLDWPEFSPLLSAWSGRRLAGIDVSRLRGTGLPAQYAPLRGVLLDHLYVADPAAGVTGPAISVPGADPQPPSPLGELREQVAANIFHIDKRSTKPLSGYPGLDARAVILHVLHGWGGGAERFVRDLAAADGERHHLVLVARGNFPRRCFGETLELFDGAMTQPPLRRLALPNPIRSTALQHRTYAAFLYALTREFGVGAVVVSSLIGHSLDALRTSLPTLIVGHDFYPLWPLLHRDFGNADLAFDAAHLAADLAGAGNAFEFAERDSAYWSALREGYVAAAVAANARFIAPSQSMLSNLLRIEPRLAALQNAVIAHGLAPWPDGSPIAPVPPARQRLRLLMPGRVRAGKGADLLRAALPGLREHAEVFLLGAGADGEQFFGAADVHVVLNYERDELPALIARIAPDAALLLPTVAETFSYALSELRSLRVPVIATRIGALAERIIDGLDGWLVDITAEAIVELVARLRGERGELERVRALLHHQQARTTSEMAADYRAALPLATSAGPRYTLTQATSDRLLAQARAADLGNEQRANARLRATNREQQDELERRADWGMTLDREVRRERAIVKQRDVHIRAQEQAYAEQQQLVAARTEWAQAAVGRETAAREELGRFAMVHAQLQAEFDERTQWAKALDAELNAMRVSTSWRLTRPVRFLSRKLRAARVRIAFAWQRLRSMFRRTRGSLATRGATGTLRRIGDELRRGAPLTAGEPVAEPAADYTPFDVPAAATPRVSIVIPVHNKVDYTLACLRSIVEQAGTTPLEIIVVDDASSDASADHLARIGGLKVIRNEHNLGFVGSCNSGAACARGEFVLFLNNDTVVTAGWLEALLRTFDEEPRAGLVGAKLVYPDGRLQEAGGIVFRDGSGWNYGRFDDPADPRYGFRREADYCSGAAILLRRELFERLGGFDTRYAPAYYEDTDLAFAVRAAGLKAFYEPRSTVVHFEGVSAGTDTGAGMKRFQIVNRDKFLEKWKSELDAQPAPIHEARFAAAAANHRSRGRILIVDAYTPTPDQDSGSLRMVNVMRLLRELGYAVAFLPDNRAHMGAYTQALQALGVEALYHPYVPDPVSWIRDHGRTLDAIVLSRHYIAVNYVGAARLYAPQARLIFDTVDLHYLREERAAGLDDRPQLARLAAQTRAQELKLMREADVTLVVSAAEKQLLARELPNARVEVLSNVHAVHGCRKPFGERRDMVFVGGFQHPPNVDAVRWFATEVMPLLRAQGDAPRLHVIGSKVPPEVVELEADDVVVHGYVADIEPYLDGCRLSIAPLRYGAGVKGKVNMAMSYGLPVVATTIAVEGMHVRDGFDVVTADSADAFAAAIRRVHDDEELWQALSANGLANVREHFSFDAARAALRKILPERPAP